MPFKIRWQGLRFKIIAWAYIPVALILLAIGLWNLVIFQMTTQALMIENSRTATQLMAGRLADALAPLTDPRQTVARTTSLAQDRVSQQAILTQSRPSLSLFDAGVVLLDGQGVVLAAEPQRPDIIGQNWSDRAYLSRMVSAPGVVISDIVRDGIDRYEVVAIAVPVPDARGAMVGTLTGMFRVGPNIKSELYAVFSQFVKWQDDNYLVERGPLIGGFFFDHNGRVIYHSQYITKVSEHVGATT